MSEEEIINKIKKIIKEFKKQYPEYIIYGDEIKAIQGLLDLYKKEKQEKEKFKKALGKRITYCNELEKDLFENCSKYIINRNKIKSIQIIDLDGKIHNVYKLEEE